MNIQRIDKLAGEPYEPQAQSDGQAITKGGGFSARSYRHTEFSGLMDPLIMVDHFVMTEPTFGTHAHAGLSAVTVMFEDSEGAFWNRDSLGNDIDLAPGDLYWFKAASGAIHNEQPRSGSRTHALQVFVNLPEAKRHDAPGAFHIPASDIPLIHGERAKARLVLGKSNGVTGTPAPDISMTILDIKIQSVGYFLHQGESGDHAWLLAIDGAPTIWWNDASVELKSGSAIALDGGTDISISSETEAHVVLFRGQPIRQAFVQRGPFAMGNAAELDAVEAKYRAGRLGSID
ncbi:MAG: pirin family protein [Pseudomonadota bacterium]